MSAQMNCRITGQKKCGKGESMGTRARDDCLCFFCVCAKMKGRVAALKRLLWFVSWELSCTPVPLVPQNPKSQMDKPRRIFRRGTNT